MAPRNRQDGEVKIFVGTDKLSIYTKNICNGIIID